MATIHIHKGCNYFSKGRSEVKIQNIPCRIHADTDAKVSQFFEPYVKKRAEDGMLTASLRGRRLLGRNIKMPHGYMGLILHESIGPMTDKEERKFYVIHEFDSLVYWNWDKKPSANDTLVRAMEWIDIAEALHSPIVDVE